MAESVSFMGGPTTVNRFAAMMKPGLPTRKGLVGLSDESRALAVEPAGVEPASA
jgi:hypothetical protein